MKQLAPAVLLALLAACAADPAPSDDATLDFTTFQTAARPAEDFVRACQQESGFNFTYDAETQRALAATTIRIEGDGRVDRAGFESFLRAELERAGFTCSPVGPADLHVYAIERRAR